MKIGIFGDSYARTFDNLNHTEKLGPAWWEILSEKYQVENHGLAGSAAYYSVEQFDEQHQNYDRVIFIMTFPGRVYLGKENRIVTTGYPSVINANFNNYDSALRNLKLLREFKNYDKTDEKRIQAVMDYFLYVCNLKEEQFKIDCYSDHVRKVRPDSLLLTSDQLCKASILEQDWWGLNSTDISKLLEIRKCHFTNENNVVLARMYDTWIQTGEFNFSVDQFVKPADPWQKYFKSYNP